MKRTVSINFLAEQELNDAAEYYEAESVGLGKAFLKEIERIFNFIVKYPEAAPLINQTVRKKRVNKFPYVVIYSLRRNHLRILAVMNQKRRPFYWIGRM